MAIPIDPSYAALLLIDLQNDFLPGGALPVPEGDAVIPIANRLLPRFERVVATQDWHPPDHVSFAANHPGKKVGDAIEVDGQRQVLWPVHCVANTGGSSLAADLDAGRISHVVHKGADPLVDSYSGFFDDRRRGTGLHDYLSECGVSQVYILGVATDYCVKCTALDARRLGLAVVLIADGCRGLNAAPGDVERAIGEMRAAGVQVEESAGERSHG